MRMMRAAGIACAILALLSAAAASAEISGTLYVRTDGNDVTGDGTLGNPFLTKQRAVDEATVNGLNGPLLIDVGVGVYGTQTTIIPITGASETNTVTIRGAPDHQSVINSNKTEYHETSAFND